MKETNLQTVNKIKKKSRFLALLLMGLVLAACKPASEPESLAGYIVLEENTLYLDEIEVITIEDEDRIAELDLKDGDMPNGYYIHNPKSETILLDLTNETTYTFTDYALNFVEDADSDRLYTTTKKEHFIQHLNNSYSGEPPAGNVPFFIEVKDGKVISITEKLIFTQ